MAAARRPVGGFPEPIVVRYSTSRPSRYVAAFDARMKALLLSKYRQLEIAEVPVPFAGPGEVLLRVAACGICGSDVHGYDGASGRRIPPIVMGHEAAGTVAALGAGVTKFAVGDRVTFDSTVHCGACAYCLRGEINLCDRREVLGVSCGDYRRAGAFAEFIAVPEHIVYRMPDGLSFEEAAMLEAVAVAVHAVSLTPVAPGSSSARSCSGRDPTCRSSWSPDTQAWKTRSPLCARARTISLPSPWTASS